MHNNFEFIDAGNTKTFKKYMDSAKSRDSGLHIGKIKGTAAMKKGGSPLVVNYKKKDISGDALKKQLTKWAEYGTIEPDAAEALCNIATGPLSLIGQVYVLIGAGSAMGPYSKLLEHGATVVCIDIPGKWGERPAAMWQRLIDTAKASSGTIIFPLSEPQTESMTDAELIKNVGCDLMNSPGPILNWLKTVEKDKSMCVGNYTYLDGELHVKLSIFADAVIAGLREARPDTKVAFLCTPTDLHIVTDAAYNASVANYGWHPGRLVEFFFQIISFGKWLKKNALTPLKTDDSKKTLKYVDGISVDQGPNYALAKRLQHWRAMIEYENGGIVSSNIAPSTATLSVVSNRTFGWAYGGMPYFKPFEIFQQETTNGVMAAMLIHDTTSADSAANPKNRKKFGIDNTMELFKYNSVHGGVWRAAYKTDSIGVVSVLIHFMGGPKAFLPVVFLFILLCVAGYLHFIGQLAQYTAFLNM